MAKLSQATALLFAALAIAQPFVALGANGSPGNSGGTPSATGGTPSGNGGSGSPGNSGNTPSATGTTGQGGSKGDPVIQAFDGTPFFFHGVPGGIYNLISMKDSFQVWSVFRQQAFARN